MSLINDALKKAQKQRTGEAAPLGGMPGVGGQPAARIAQRNRPNSSGIPYLQIGIGVGVALFLIVGSVFLGRFLLNRPSEPEPVKPAVVAKAAPKPEAPAPIAPAPASTPTNFTLPIATPPITTVAAPVTTVATTPAPVTTQAVVAKTPPPVAPAPEPEPVKGPPPVLKLETRAITFIESLRVAGIRASATDSKVLMNDRVYRIGNIVEHEMGIKLTGITANSLTFEDERGASYTRNF